MKFFDYALLGDDNVIADPVVVKSYLEVMEATRRPKGGDHIKRKVRP